MPDQPRGILCPLCKNGLTLDDFVITEHADGTWSADEPIECTHIIQLRGSLIELACIAVFMVDHSRARFLPKEVPLKRKAR